MARNILIFSDGTGQVGGSDFDEDRTNVYKLYRATRVGPTNLVEREEEPDAIELAPDEGSVDLLQKIYRSSRQPIARRMRAAIEAAPYERPKFAVTAVSNLSGDHFAAMLERAVQRSRAPLQIEHRPNDGPLPEPRPRGIHGRSGEGQR